jgi:site-specific recombinase XerD
LCYRGIVYSGNVVKFQQEWVAGFTGICSRGKGDKNMNEKQSEILKEYLSFLHTQGVKTTNHKSGVRMFLSYANAAGIDILRLRIAEAQEFQLYLATKTKDDGKIALSKVTVSSIVDRVRRFYDYLKKRKLIHANPFNEIQKIKVVKGFPRNILNEGNMDKFLRHLKEFWKGENLFERRRLYRAHVIAELMYSTGARINEVTKLDANDIDFTRNTVLVRDSKTGKSRECILNEYASKILRIYIDDMRECVMTASRRKGNPLFGGNESLTIWLNGILNKESERLGMGRFTSHNFRHAVGYHLLRAGCDIRYIKEILGHEDLGTTQVYTKVDKEDLRNIIDEFHPRRISLKLDSVNFKIET